jgi:hypothetical protein
MSDGRSDGLRVGFGWALAGREAVGNEESGREASWHGGIPPVLVR